MSQEQIWSRSTKDDNESIGYNQQLMDQHINQQEKGPVQNQYVNYSTGQHQNNCYTSDNLGQQFTPTLHLQQFNLPQQTHYQSFSQPLPIMQQMSQQNLHFTPYQQPTNLLPLQQPLYQAHQQPWFMPAQPNSYQYTNTQNMNNGVTTFHNPHYSNTLYQSEEFNSDENRSLSSIVQPPSIYSPINSSIGNHNNVTTYPPMILQINTDDSSYHKPRSTECNVSSPSSDRSSISSSNSQSGKSPNFTSDHLKVRRSRMGCLTCRHRKKRCCETRPNCKECERLGLSCTWPTPGSEHRNRSKIARLTDGYHYDAYHGNIKILRGVVESRIDI